jgi:uncharacterized Rmd1/YagE family protein
MLNTFGQLIYDILKTSSRKRICSFRIDKFENNTVRFRYTISDGMNVQGHEEYITIQDSDTIMESNISDAIHQCIINVD